MHLLCHSWLQVMAGAAGSLPSSCRAWPALLQRWTLPLCCRGKFRSKPWQDVVTEAKALVASGVKELNLIAGVLRFMLTVHIPSAVPEHAALHLAFLDPPSLMQRTRTSMARTGGTARA